MRGDTGEVPVVQQIAPGVAEAVVNGTKLTARADGYISLEEVVQEFGSTERYLGEMVMAGIDRTQASDGTALFANGAIGYFEDLSPTYVPEVQTVESRQQTVPWMEQQVGGETVTVFADGYISFGMDEREPGVLGRSNIPSAPLGSGVIWADGMIELD